MYFNIYVYSIWVSMFNIHTYKHMCIYAYQTCMYMCVYNSRSQSQGQIWNLRLGFVTFS